MNENVPEIFTLETATACNLRCPECAIGGGMMGREKEFLSFDRFKIIADKARPYARGFYLHIWGEPMLNREIIPMIRYASAFSRTNISTNGNMMTTAMAEELITSGVGDVIVSIDGVSQEVYEQYRVGGSAAKAFEALEMLQRSNVRHGGKVRIIPQFIAFRHNQHEMALFRERCGALGLDPSFKAPYIRNEGSRFSCCDIPQLRRPHFPDVASLRRAMIQCSNPRNVFTILIDGSVVACCHDYGKTTCFGNIFTQDVMEIWNSSSYRSFRDEVMSGNAPDFCVRNCMTYFLDKPEDRLKPAAPGVDLQRQPAVPTQGKVNLCCGPVKVPGFLNIDVNPGADLIIDLERELLPFPDESLDVVTCISAINYFTRQRAQEIIHDVFRVLKPGGIARFASQDLRVLAAKYLENDREFYFQQLPDGRERFNGKTIADKLNAFFYGYYSGDKHCKYVYDFESLKQLFSEAGFTEIEQKGYRESRIAEVEQLDNRPEQMFFLEAVKGNSQFSAERMLERLQQIKQKLMEEFVQKETCSAEEYRRRAIEIFPSQPEQGWQLLLKALELKPDDRESVIKCATILEELGRHEDQVKLYSRYLELQPDDGEMAQSAQAVLPKLKHARERKHASRKDRDAADRFFQRLNRVLPDVEHLAACMKWLRNAHSVNRGGGVAAAFYLGTRQWDVDYPETTGYIIPTFLAYGKITGEEAFRKWAIEMGDWETAIQAPEGGVGEPVGVYGLRPRVFNTGQVLLGWLALYAETGEQKYLDSARRGADWIVANLDSEGKWTAATYRGPKAYKCRVAWALLELYKVTGEHKYREAAERALRWVLRQARPNGWFDNNSLTDPGRPWTHLIGYVLVGVLEIYRLDNADFDRHHLLGLLNNAAHGMIRHYLATKKRSAGFTTLAGTFDETWSSDDSWACVTGTAQVEFFLRRLHRYTGDDTMVQAADMLLDDLKQLHLIDGITESALFGGLPGSYPAGAPYCSYSVPNWGVKFFADSLLQRLLPCDGNYIG